VTGDISEKMTCAITGRIVKDEEKEIKGLGTREARKERRGGEKERNRSEDRRKMRRVEAGERKKEKRKGNEP